ncbi:MAG TPA: nitroreductase/quinone reductase family protein [Candidatus Limnocylindrales bacterium]|jgi:hypothetical protein
MSFSAEDRALLDRIEEVEIETQRPDGPIHRTTIWTIVDGDEVFVRSYRGERARWYRDALANPAVAILADGRRLAATAIAAGDPQSIERASAGFRRKYAGDPAAGAMVRPEVLSTTLRLEPA